MKGVPKPAVKSPSEGSAPTVAKSRAAPVLLAGLVPGPAPAAARGHDAVFAQIFRDPYGPRAYRKYMQTRHRSVTPYLGISCRDKIRMRHYLGQLAAADRQDRFLKGAALSLVGGVLIAVGGLAIYDVNKSSDPASSQDKWILGAMIGLGCAMFFTKSPIERMLHLYRKDPDLNLRLSASPLPGGAAVAVSGRF